MNITEYPGSCYCASIGFRYRTAISPQDWSIRACQCRFCVAHDALSTSDPGGELDFAADIDGDLQRFRFGLRTADFLLCRNCGVYIGAVIDAEAGHFGIINTHALDTSPGNVASVAPMTYDSENTAGRVERRIKRWTPVAAVPW